MKYMSSDMYKSFMRKILQQHLNETMNPFKTIGTTLFHAKQPEYNFEMNAAYKKFYVYTNYFSKPILYHGEKDSLASAFFNTLCIYYGTSILEGEYDGKIISTYSQSSRNEE